MRVIASDLNGDLGRSTVHRHIVKGADAHHVVEAQVERNIGNGLGLRRHLNIAVHPVMVFTNELEGRQILGGSLAGFERALVPGGMQGEAAPFLQFRVGILLEDSHGEKQGFPCCQGRLELNSLKDAQRQFLVSGNLEAVLA